MITAIGVFTLFVAVLQGYRADALIRATLTPSPARTMPNEPTPVQSKSDHLTLDQTTPAPVGCGPVPSNIHSCIGGPKLVKPEWASGCIRHTDECDLMTCVYKQAGWINSGIGWTSNGETIDKLKISADFNKFAKEQPVWSEAVKQAMADCVETDLPPQGIYLKCPAYDVTNCIETALVKNASPSQWSNSTKCTRSKQLASSCPFCPEDCFAPIVPEGSCNACLALPRRTKPSPSLLSSSSPSLTPSP